MRRGKSKRPVGKLLTVWVSKELLPQVDQCVRAEDTDRSKFIRNAIREKLARHAQSSK